MLQLYYGVFFVLVMHRYLTVHTVHTYDHLSLSLTAEEDITWMNHTIVVVVVVLAGDSIKFGHG